MLYNGVHCVHVHLCPFIILHWDSTILHISIIYNPHIVIQFMFHIYMIYIYRLVQDREVDLTDGTRLLRHDRFIEAMSVSGLTEQEMRER